MRNGSFVILGAVMLWCTAVEAAPDDLTVNAKGRLKKDDVHLVKARFVVSLPDGTKQALCSFNKKIEFIKGKGTLRLEPDCGKAIATNNIGDKLAGDEYFVVYGYFKSDGFRSANEYLHEYKSKADRLVFMRAAVIALFEEVLTLRTKNDEAAIELEKEQQAREAEEARLNELLRLQKALDESEQAELRRTIESKNALIRDLRRKNKEQAEAIGELTKYYCNLLVLYNQQPKAENEATPVLPSEMCKQEALVK